MSMINFMIAPSIAFSDELDINYNTREKFKSIFIKTLFLNNVTRDNINTIHIIPSDFFNISKVDNELYLGVPNMSYDIDENGCGYFWCENKYDVFDYTVRYNTVNITCDQMIFVLSHELSHYLNGDLDFINSLLQIIFSFTSDAIFLFVLCYIVMIHEINIVYLLIPIICNHSYTYKIRNQERKADKFTFHLNKQMKQESVKLWIDLDNNLNNKKRNTKIQSIIINIIYHYKILICGRTHPTYQERISYSL
jgi:hypothetical protein